jgi:hypothetical protein
MEKRLIRVSKYLAKYLRHSPHEVGLTLRPGGWVPVDDLLAAAEEHGFPISYDELVECVETDDKKRFSFDETGDLIRANRGHSVEVGLRLDERQPPEILYHGTVERLLPAILDEGLDKPPQSPKDVLKTQASILSTAIAECGFDQPSRDEVGDALRRYGIGCSRPRRSTKWSLPRDSWLTCSEDSIWLARQPTCRHLWPSSASGAIPPRHGRTNRPRLAANSHRRSCRCRERSSRSKDTRRS